MSDTAQAIAGGADIIIARQPLSNWTLLDRVQICPARHQSLTGYRIGRMFVVRFGGAES